LIEGEFDGRCLVLDGGTYQHFTQRRFSPDRSEANPPASILIVEDPHSQMVDSRSGVFRQPNLGAH
jgi:hypothetical protein